MAANPESKGGRMTFTENTEGLFAGLPAEQYHKAPGLSHSMLKSMNPPARLPVYLTEKREPTVDMIMGTLVHQAILEPNAPWPQIAVKPETYPDKKTGEAKPWHGGATYCKEWV